MSPDKAVRVQGSPARDEETRVPRLPTPPLAAKAAALVKEPLNKVGEQFDPRQASRRALNAKEPVPSIASQTFLDEKTGKSFSCEISECYSHEREWRYAVATYINDKAVDFCKEHGVDKFCLFGEEDRSLEQIQLLKQFKFVQVSYFDSQMEELLLALLSDNSCTTHIVWGNHGNKRSLENVSKLVQAIRANQTVRFLDLSFPRFQNDEDAHEVFICQNSNLKIFNPHFYKFAQSNVASTLTFQTRPL